MCEHDLVKVAVRGHVGVHGGLSHCSRPQELSSVFVIHEQLLHALECLSAPLDLLINLISVQELQLIFGVCR